MGDKPWNQNEGKFDTPSSSAPKVSAPARPRGSAPAVPTVMDDLPLLSASAGAIAAADDTAIVDEIDPDRVSGPGEEKMGKVLHEIVERLETLIDQRGAIADSIRELMAFAKAIGLDPPAIRAVVKDRAADPDKRKQREANIAVYRHALKVEGPDFVIELPTPPAPLPVRKRAITAKDKAFNDVGAWLDAVTAFSG